VRAGRLRHLVDLRDPGTRTKDGKGGYTDPYDEKLSPSTWYCSIDPATPSVLERTVAATIEAKVTHVVTGRYHAGISTKTRLTHRGRFLFVRAVQNVEERNRELVLLCEEVLEP
jgi:head-tail adaptor